MPLVAEYTRSCRALLDEIAGYAWDERKAEKGEDSPVKVDDHSVDALRYAVHTTQAACLRLLEPVPVPYVL
ncbi:hypothetical protein ACQEVF_52010 [Nonomuraea polychroma]|uniref:hypothetical protein n=1 Tax=Nonomuraea polychroma TaxID=46176 RepID=UPI003D8B7072